MISGVLKIGPRVTVLPVVNGSADFSWEVRRWMLDNEYDCVAVPLPESFRQDVEHGIELLPTPTIVVQRQFSESEWSDSSFSSSWKTDAGFESGEESGHDKGSDDGADHVQEYCSYVPIDPCQPVIAALRAAMGERVHCEFIDLETSSFEIYGQTMPDSYALKKVKLEKFAATLLPVIERPTESGRIDRILFMAKRLKCLSEKFEKILFICNVLDWPWIKEAFDDPNQDVPQGEPVHDTRLMKVESNSLYFLLGELPFITGLYESARADLENDEFLSIDGVKSLLLVARNRYQATLQGRARRITPFLLATCLKYLRNLTLLERRFTPDLPDIVTAAKQVFGDQFALHVFETAKQYQIQDRSSGLDEVRMGIEQIAFPDGLVANMANRLPGVPTVWRTLDIRKNPEESDRRKWQQRWNPHQQCSWPPEDEIVENFRQTVFDRARQIMGSDLSKTEKFTSSIKDGIDIRDTLRHWYEGQIYVKVLPPNRGDLDCAVMLFDSPADPRHYPWRATWFAEHDNESTLAFFATSFAENPVGPGICCANYGGALFLFPPRPIVDVWTDPQLDFTETLEERLLAAACVHSRSSAIALLSPVPPGPGLRRLAKKYGKSWVHVPITQFGSETIAQLRYLHVLNGQEVRCYASDFIRKA